MGLAAFIPIIGTAVDKLLDLIPDANARARAEAEFQRQILAAVVEEGRDQRGINKVEAAHQSIFVAGWRPFIGWVGGFGMAYQFMLYPLLTWVWPIVLPSAPIPPVLDGDVLFAMVSGMLGLAGMRSFDKMKGVDAKVIGR